MHRVRIGTRASPLARAQTLVVEQGLRRAFPDLEIEVVDIATSGDADPRELSEINERGIFATALEQALLDGSIDVAVHSCKDLRLEDPPGLALVCVLPRADARDVLCGAAGSLHQLPHGARIATGSARRASALATLRPDLVPTPIRGNVATRLARSAERGDDACMLAAAGLDRLDLRSSAGGFALDVGAVVPEAGQGIVVVQARDGGPAVELPWSALEDGRARWAMRVERGAALHLGGGCERPVGVHVAPSASGWDGWVFHAPSPGAPGTITHVPIDHDVDEAAAIGTLLGAVASQQGSAR